MAQRVRTLAGGVCLSRYAAVRRNPQTRLHRLVLCSFDRLHAGVTATPTCMLPFVRAMITILERVREKQRI